MLELPAMPGKLSEAVKAARAAAAAAGREAAEGLRGAEAAAAVEACGAAAAGSEHGAVIITTWKERNTRGAKKFVVRFAAGGDIQEDAWVQLFLEVEAGVALGTGETMKHFYRHYSVSEPAVSRKRTKFAKSLTLAVGEKTGRIGYIGNEAFLEALREANSAQRGQSSRDLAAKLSTPAGVKYRGQTVLVPDQKTVLAAMDLGVWSMLASAVRKRW